MTHPYWPFFDLVIRTPRLELRAGTDEDLVELAAISGDIHDPDRLPFRQPWSKQPSPERERGLLQWHWFARAELKPEKWALLLVARSEGKVIGTQSLLAENFGVLRSAKTASWIGRPWQGKGLGTEMRLATLHLLFESLGGEEAISGAWAWNEQSIAVTKKLGYEDNGLATEMVEGKADMHRYFRMTRASWDEHAKNSVPVEVVGIEACLPLLGV